MMRAIVLTYDRNRVLTDHMIRQYEKLWPDHPFQFRIPSQNPPVNPSSTREYVRTPEGIRDTTLTLLQDLEDEEWIYWTIDDKYLIEIDLNRVAAIYNWIEQGYFDEMSGILFCRCRNMLNPEYLKGQIVDKQNGLVYLERKGYEQIWIHQFLKVKVIRHLFQSFPVNIPKAKAMDRFKKSVKKPKSHHLFVTEQNLAVFGESTEIGNLTENCYQSLVQNGMDPPPWFTNTNGRTVIMGELN